MQKITLILVIYQEKIAQLPIFSLLTAIANQNRFQVILYDNSPTAQENPLSAENITYFHDASNPGLAKAYNYGWHKAQANHSNALLLLDDDTEISLNYLEKLMKIELTADLGAIVPLIFAEETQISPVAAEDYISSNHQNLSAGKTSQRLMAINSGACIPLAVLNQIGGFNEAFPLDFLDHWFFWRLYQEKLAVEILDEKLQHQLSVLDYQQVSPQRYLSIVMAENLYYREYETTLQKRHRQQLFLRLLKQFLLVKNRKIWRITWQELTKKTK
ncbi:glycosyltransferase involved in cell wall biosynthesis [Enterococcus sp. PF1-24]|uniref:glycosyltransferase n=1 Tax=unclassified Enterococcus TaxID=2608891 RepID=UPI002476D450|nr:MULTISPECIES: glycosyltransferase [unclassified Enterococcus]MDH6364552.1 glycosyltransferase involved in cell wall biosynthesis [Enterococcus sp. PFB1-1]MDH6401653.1 glycosyltransferase involved in cell wall biosynthesis [Enterococcus sp. PF1-24]